MRGMLSEDELRVLIASGEIETVVTVFPDMYGRLMGKRITGHFFLEEVLTGGMHCCDYLLACDMEMDPVGGYAFASWEKGYGDVLCRPDLGTLRRAAWLDKSAIVLCDVCDETDGSLISIAPRNVLRAQLGKAAELGFVAKAGAELEFFLLRDSYDEAVEKSFDNLRTFGSYVEDYHTLSTIREEPLVSAIRRNMDDSGVPVEFSKGEWGPGQHEINLRYAEMLEMADRHVIYKQAAKEMAIVDGHALTFMAKFHEDLAGNSLHLHTSLWSAEDGASSFAGDEPLAGTRVNSSAVFRWWLGGQIAHAHEIALLLAPNVNSYKRYVEGSFAPTSLAWSYDNRTAGFRVVGEGDSLRVECRIAGGDANPYLAMAGLLAAGLDGIRNRTEPPAAFQGDAYAAANLPRVPVSLEAALEVFRESSFLAEAFGDAVVAHYSHFAQVELDKFRKDVTTWERRRFLERG